MPKTSRRMQTRSSARSRATAVAAGAICTDRVRATRSSSRVAAANQSLTPPTPVKQRNPRKKVAVDSTFLVDYLAPPPGFIPKPEIIKKPSLSSISRNKGKNNVSHNVGKKGGKTRSKQYVKNSKEIFDDRILQLKDFKVINGHVNVTQSYDMGLYRWCHRKRTSKSKLTDWQIAALDDIDFQWECKQYVIKTFDERLEELRTFQKLHGHCKVTVRYNLSLSTWCQHLKMSIKAYRQGCSPHVRLDRSQISLLDDLGFVWE